MNRGEIRGFILKIKGPFSSTDLFLLLEKEERLKQQRGQCLEVLEEGHEDQEKNVGLRDLALQVLDELYDRGLVGFERVGESSFGFYVL